MCLIAMAVTGCMSRGTLEPEGTTDHDAWIVAKFKERGMDKSASTHVSWRKIVTHEWAWEWLFYQVDRVNLEIRHAPSFSILNRDKKKILLLLKDYEGDVWLLRGAALSGSSSDCIYNADYKIDPKRRPAFAYFESSAGKARLTMIDYDDLREDEGIIINSICFSDQQDGYVEPRNSASERIFGEQGRSLLLPGESDQQSRFYQGDNMGLWESTQEDTDKVFADAKAKCARRIELDLVKECELEDRSAEWAKAWANGEDIGPEAESK